MGNPALVLAVNYDVGACVSYADAPALLSFRAHFIPNYSVLFIRDWALGDDLPAINTGLRQGQAGTVDALARDVAPVQRLDALFDACCREFGLHRDEAHFICICLTQLDGQTVTF